MTTIFLGHNLLAQSNFSGERLKKACLDYIQKKVGNDAQVSIIKNIEDQYFEESNVYARCNSTRESLRGNTNLALEFIVDNQLLRRLEVPVRIKTYKQTIVAAGNIKRGETINETDVIEANAETTYYLEEELLNKESIIGKKAKQNITQGTIITLSMLESDNIIKRGDKVFIFVISGPIKISTTGVALQDASVGKPIRVKRDGTQTVLTGKVDIDGTIVIASR